MLRLVFGKCFVSRTMFLEHELLNAAPGAARGAWTPCLPIHVLLGTDQTRPRLKMESPKLRRDNVGFKRKTFWKRRVSGPNINWVQILTAHASRKHQYRFHLMVQGHQSGFFFWTLTFSWFLLFVLCFGDLVNMAFR